jgi:hypothetical protein
MTVIGPRDHNDWNQLILLMFYMDTLLLDNLQIDPKSICSSACPLNDVDALKKIMRRKMAAINNAVNKLPTHEARTITDEYPQLFVTLAL